MAAAKRRSVDNKRALLEGARQCLLEKGYERTTVRDITAAAGGVSMAAIGYHFGSREALLMEALVGALEEWGEALGAISSKRPRSAAQYGRAWDRILESTRTHRALWLASFEAFLQSERVPELRSRLADGQEEGRRGVAAWLLGIDEDALEEKSVRGIGSIQMALMSGIVGQVLLDPERTPSGPEIARALRELADLFE